MINKKLRVKKITHPFNMWIIDNFFEIKVLKKYKKNGHKQTHLYGTRVMTT